MNSLAARRTESWTGVALACAVALLVALAVGQAWRLQERVRQKAELISGGRAADGALAIARHGCGGCHTIPGIAGARGLVGPPLDHIGRRAVIGGRLSNDPDDMVKWLRSPQTVSPGTDMPDMGLSAREARDIAAYLYTLQ